MYDDMREVASLSTEGLWSKHKNSDEKELKLKKNNEQEKN